jgi:hypothetical protein
MLTIVAIALAAMACVAVPPVEAKDDADQTAKLNAKLTLVSARLIAMQKGSDAEVTPKTLATVHSQLEFVEDGPSTKPTVVGVKSAGNQLRIAVYGSNTCWGARQELSTGDARMITARRSGPADKCTATSFSDGDFKENGWGR